MLAPQRKRHILLLGGSGKLGRLLRRHWAMRPPEQFIPHWQFRENPPQDGVLWRPGDPVPTLDAPISALVALWGVTPGENHDLAQNSRLARAAIDLGAALEVDRVLHCSTAAVYDPGPNPLPEDTTGHTLNPYGAAKLEMERTIAAQAGSARNCVMRIANVAGADSLFAALAREAGAITLDQFADGTGPVRSYISPTALARVIETLVSCPRDALPDIVNVASPRPVAMADIARAAGRAVLWRPAPPAAAAMVQLDTDLLHRLVALPDETAQDLVDASRNLRDPR